MRVQICFPFQRQIETALGLDAVNDVAQASMVHRVLLPGHRRSELTVKMHLPSRVEVDASEFKLPSARNLWPILAAPTVAGFTFSRPLRLGPLIQGA